MKKLLLASLIASASLSGTAMAAVDSDGAETSPAPSTSATVTWTANVDGICGIFVNDSDAEITFKGGILKDGVELEGRTNTADGKVIMSFSEDANDFVDLDGADVNVNLVDKEGVPADDYITKSGKVVEIFAKADTKAAEVLIGEHSYSATVTIECPSI